MCSEVSKIVKMISMVSCFIAIMATKDTASKALLKHGQLKLSPNAFCFREAFSLCILASMSVKVISCNKRQKN